MNAWWQGLNKRERNLVMVAAILTLLALGWMLIIKPLSQYKAFLHMDLKEAQEVHLLMQQQRADILRLRASGPAASPVTGGTLYSGINLIVKQYQLSGGDNDKLDEKNRDTVTLKLENKSFDALARLLSQAETRFAARATSLSLKPAGETGLVDAQITLER